MERRKSTKVATTFNIGISKEVVIKIFSACKSNLMGKTYIDFFEKHDKRGEGYYSSATFMKIMRNTLKISMNDASDNDMATFIKLIKFEDDQKEDVIKVTSIANAFEKGAAGFIRSSARLLSNEVKVIEEYDPYVEFVGLREQTKQQLVEMEKLYGTKEICLTLDDREEELARWEKDREEGKHLHPTSNNNGQIGSINGCLESIALTEMGEYARRCQVQRMADIPPTRRELTKFT